MKSLFLINLYIFLALLSFAQNLVQIKDFSDNFDKQDVFSSIYSNNENIIVLYNKKSTDFKSTSSNLNNKNTSNYNNQVIDLVIDNTKNEQIILSQIKNVHSSKIIVQKVDEKKNLINEKEIVIDFSPKQTFIEQHKDEIHIVGLFEHSFKVGNFELQKTEKTNIFILKLDKELNVINSFTVECVLNKLTDFKIIADKIFIAGTVIKNTKTLHKDEDAIFVNIDINNFNEQKTLHIAGKYAENGLFINKDSKNNIYLTGYFTGELAINDSILQNSGSKDVFICKYSPNFDFIWANSFGSAGNDYLSDIKINDFNDIYLTGTYRTQINDNPKQDLFFNTFVTKFDNNGTLKYIYTINDTTKNYYAPKIEISCNNTIIVASNSLYLDKRDNFIREYFDCDYGKKIDLPKEINIYENQTSFSAEEGFTDYLWSNGTKTNKINFNQSGLFHLTVTDSNGCISVDSVNVEFLNKTYLNEPENNTVNFCAEIHPNPAIGNFDINVKNASVEIPMQIFIFSQTGSVVFYKNIEKPDNNFSLNINLNLSSGTYPVKIIQNNNIFYQKVVIIN